MQDQQVKKTLDLEKMSYQDIDELITKKPKAERSESSDMVYPVKYKISDFGHTAYDSDSDFGYTAYDSDYNHYKSDMYDDIIQLGLKLDYNYKDNLPLTSKELFFYTTFKLTDTKVRYWTRKFKETSLLEKLSDDNDDDSKKIFISNYGQSATSPTHDTVTKLVEKLDLESENDPLLKEALNNPDFKAGKAKQVIADKKQAEEQEVKRKEERDINSEEMQSGREKAMKRFEEQDQKNDQNFMNAKKKFKAQLEIFLTTNPQTTVNGHGISEELEKSIKKYLSKYSKYKKDGKNKKDFLHFFEKIIKKFYNQKITYLSIGQLKAVIKFLKKDEVFVDADKHHITLDKILGDIKKEKIEQLFACSDSANDKNNSPFYEKKKVKGEEKYFFIPEVKDEFCHIMNIRLNHDDELKQLIKHEQDYEKNSGKMQITENKFIIKLTLKIADISSLNSLTIDHPVIPVNDSGFFKAKIDLVDFLYKKVKKYKDVKKLPEELMAYRNALKIQLKEDIRITVYNDPLAFSKHKDFLPKAINLIGTAFIGFATAGLAPLIKFALTGDASFRFVKTNREKNKREFEKAINKIPALPRFTGK